MPPKKKILSTFIAFDVLYADGTRSSNRRVPFTELGGLDGDTPALAFIAAQDHEIGVASGKPRPEIRTIMRSPLKPSRE
jgi:hypothetical protein